MLSRADLFEKYQASSSSGGSKSSGSSSSKSSGRSSLFDKYEKNERSYRSGKECVYDLQKVSSLFSRNVVDGYGRIGAFLENDDWRVDMDIDGDGILEDGVSIADAVALSCDSELDLYIQKELENIFDKYNCYNLKQLFGKADAAALKELERLGIRADAVGDDSAWQNRTYAFSLVDTSAFGDEKKARLNELANKNEYSLTADEKAELEKLENELHEILYADDAKILEDEFGGKGSMIFSDCLIPDGTAQGAELNLSSILDTMGYECISKADFIDNPDAYFELMDEIALQIADGAYTPSEYNENGEARDTSIRALYGEKTLDISTAVRAVYTANGNAYGDYSGGYWGKAITFEENLALIEKRGLGSEGGTISSISVGGKEIELNPTEEGKKEAEENKAKQEKFEKILEQKVSDYKETNGVAEVPSNDYRTLVREAENESGFKHDNITELL